MIHILDRILFIYVSLCFIAQASDPSKHVAGIYVSYSINAGDGGRYFLTAVVALQQAGYDVDVLVDENNSCQTIECLKENAKSLQIILIYTHISVKIIQVVSNHIDHQKNDRKYMVFFLLGNSKLPNVFAIGKRMNVYMCLYPYDVYDKITSKQARIFAEYDVVLVNSVYTYKQYAKAVQPAYDLIYKNHLIGPSVKVLYSPVHPFLPPSTSSTFLSLSNSSSFSKLSSATSTAFLPSSDIYDSSSRSNRGGDLNEVINIIMTGDFLNGHSSKNQDYGLRILNQLVLLQQSTNKYLHLHLIGNVYPSKHNDTFEFIEKIKKYAKEKNLPVTLSNNVSPKDIAQALSVSVIYWQLTGFQQPQPMHVRHDNNNNTMNIVSNRKMMMIKHNEQSSESSSSSSSLGFGELSNREYLGVAVIEAMAAGCIPIVFNLGGTNDIVRHTINGFLANTEGEFIGYTMAILSMSIAQRHEVKSAAIETSKKFHFQNFIRNFQVIVNRGINAKIFTNVINNYIGVIRTIQLPELPLHSYEKIAVIIEPDIHAHFEFCVRNIIHYIDRSWSIQVHHSHDNEAYVKSVLSNIPFILYRLLPMRVTSAKEYNVLMKSVHFWESFEAEKVLIFQSDSVLLKYGINKYVEYDYIGAPWDVERNDKLRSLVNGAVGNGGFSIRSVSMMLKILNTYGNHYNNNRKSISNITKGRSSDGILSSSSSVLDNEDLFFVYYCEQLGPDICKIANPQEAYLFALEVPIKSLSQSKQAGLFPSTAVSFYDHLSLHAAWHYIPPRVTKQLLINMMKAMLMPFPNE